MEIQIAVAKINKFDSIESGDTLEVVERPNGGVSVVMADGQSSGWQAKHISTSVVRKVITLLAEGVRDGAAARAASDALFTEKSGESSAYLNILSADLETATLVITRNNPAPVFIAQRERVECLGSESSAIGLSRNIRPVITEIPLEHGTTIVMYTDGLLNAGGRIGQALDICMLLESLLEDQEPTAQEIADTILLNAIRLDNDRPDDDMSIVVLRALSKERDLIRRMTVHIPVRINEVEY
jgi:serine phosphatase RsbU (regulator of sigma subunit)